MVAHIAVAQQAVVQPVVRHGHQQPGGQVLPGMDSALEQHMVAGLLVSDAEDWDVPAQLTFADHRRGDRIRVHELKP